MTKMRALLALSSLAALAAGLAMPARAQVATSYNAPDPTVTSGTVGIARGITAGQETYTIETPTAVLDFTPSDTGIGGGAVNFQNAGTTVTYVNGTGTNSYTVLNRIVPTDPGRAVAFNGTVVSRVQQGNAVGGNVWFYSPGGIILGSTAAFDIGSLLLTTRDPTGGTGTIGSTTSFTGGGATGASIRIDQGATIDATAAGSYVALMAPAIAQRGAVRANGSVAYVAAEQATLTINSGLFDIVVDTGTDTAVDTASPGIVIDHAGTTTGPGTVGGNQAIYMVAVPKNDAITMLVQPSGQLGFDLAGAAQVVNGTVVLSAGRGITGGAIDTTPPQGAGTADIFIQGGTFTSDVVARATTSAQAASTVATADFAGDVTLQAGTNAYLAARQAGQTMTIGGDVTLISDGVFVETPPSVTGGQASLYTEGGTMTVGGNVLLRTDVTSGTNGTATGGQSRISAIGGSLSISGSVDLSARAIGGASSGLSPAASLTGGLASVEARDGGTLAITGRVRANADAVGAVSQNGTAGASQGGEASVRSYGSGGTVTIQGSVDLSAVATGHGAGAAGSVAGNGTGGAVYVRSEAGSIRIDGGTALDGSGTGGDAGVGGADGGDGQGGNVFVQANAGTGITFGSTVALVSNGRGGTNSGGGDGIGGGGTGGPAAILAIGDIAIPDDVTISATGIGGNKTAGNGGGGGFGRGGRGRILGAGGAFDIDGNITIDAIAIGGFVSGTATGNGGQGRGGGARLGTTAAGSTLTATGDVDLRADGSGNDGAGAGSVGGDGFGGDLVQGADYLEGAYLVNDAGTLTVNGNVQMSATGLAGQGATGGFGQGGIAYVSGFDGPLTVTGSVIGNVDGFGGDALTGATFGGGNGGAGLGGLLQMGTFAQNGLNGSVSLQTLTGTATGLGGRGADGVGGSGGQGGAGTGGVLHMIAEASAGAVSATTLVLSAEGDGGDGGDGAAGGTGLAGFAGGAGGGGTGGEVQIGTVSGGNFAPNNASADFGAVTLFANGVGGTGGVGGAGGGGATGAAPGAAGGNGGDGGVGGLGGIGTGGFAAVISRGTPVRITSVLGLIVGLGGDGGAAGDGGAGGAPGAGGTAGSNGALGLGGNGGDGIGGGAALSVTNRANRPERGSAIIGSMQFSAFGLGGNGGAGTSSLGGSAVAGNGAITVTNGDATLNDLNFATSLGNAPAQAPAMSIEVAGGTLDAATSLSIASNGDIALNVRDGGLLRADRLTLFGTGSLLSVAPGGTQGAAGRIEVGTDFSATFAQLQIAADLDVAGAATISGTDVTVANVAADTISIDASGDLRTGDLTAAANGYGGAGSGLLSLTALNGSIGTGDLRGADILVRQGDGGGAADVTLGNVAGERLTLVGQGNVTAGAVALTDLYQGFDPADGLQAVVNAGGGIQLSDVTAQDLLILRARGASITAGRIVTPGSVMVLTPFNVTLAGVATGTGAQDILYVSSTGFAGYDDMFRQGGQAFDVSQLFSASLGASDGATFSTGTITTGSLRAAAQFARFGDIDARQRVDLFVTRTPTFDGRVRSPDISVDSGDIVIGANGQLGDDATTDLRLRAVIFDAPVTIGGDSGAGGYHLSGAEAQRLHGRTIDITAVRSGQATATTDMVVRDLTLTGSLAGSSANLAGSDAALTLNAEGPIGIEGIVAIDAMADIDRLSITSGDRILVATDRGGSIALTGADAGALGGQLAMNARLIAAGSGTLLERLGADINFAGRDALLATPLAQPRAEGFVQARTLDFTVADLLAIQNSGSATLAGGFTAGLGGMTIHSAGDQRPGAAPQFVVWGRLEQAGGTYLTNAQTIGGIAFDGPLRPFDPASTVNGCRLGVICGRAQDPGGDTPGQVVTTVAAIDKILTTDVAEALAMPEVRFAPLVDQDGIVVEPLITEPVSGAGNSSLWQDDDSQGGAQ